MTEVWKPIEGFEGFYEVSSLGNVRSLERTISQISRQGNSYERKMPSTPLVPRATSGYLYVQLSKDGKWKNYAVHRLVATAFLPNPTGLPEVCHFDRTPSNNCVANLRWGTRQDNQNDKERHGTVLRGEQVYHAKIDNALAKKIKEEALALQGQYGIYSKLDKKYGLYRGCARAIFVGDKWKSI